MALAVLKGGIILVPPSDAGKTWDIPGSPKKNVTLAVTLVLKGLFRSCKIPLPFWIFVVRRTVVE